MTKKHTCSITNLKCFPSNERLINESLCLLNDLATGFTSVRKLVKLDEVKYLLANHTVTFLGTPHFDTFTSGERIRTSVRSLRCARNALAYDYVRRIDKIVGGRIE